ncbi:MAG: protein-disulfide reductase DsbD [Herminiimonas sp.]|nr:protein-disulfide reductase DsbD [Herminiimonas sp.]
MFERDRLAILAIQLRMPRAAWLVLGLVLLFQLAFVAGPAHADEDYLEPEAAFRFSARMLDPTHIEVHFDIADGYYMYRERLAFKSGNATLGEPDIPKGKTKYDDTFKKDLEIYRKSLSVTIPVQATGPFDLTVSSQGCADKGLCYAPMDSQARLSPAGGGLLSAAQGAMRAQGGTDTPRSDQSNAAVQREAGAPDSETGRIEASLKSGRLLAIVPLFLLLGLGLAFTPCVLPMVPILSTIIVGEGPRVSRTRGFLLAAAYALGMAIVYTLLGVAAGLIGEGLSASLQNPWALSAFALLMAVMSLSMFGVYQIQMPAALQSRLADVSGRQSGGKFVGVVAMGAISALIVGPCVAAPLAGALVYISQTRNVVIGGAALFSMAIGMSLPLLAIGLSAGSLLPRAGAWMDSVKRFFGVLMLGLALWIISPILPSWLQFAGWSLLGFASAAYLLRQRGGGWPGRVAGVLFLVLGSVQLVGLATGARDPLDPLAVALGRSYAGPNFVRVRNVAQLDAALAQAPGKTTLLDFYADWCVSCKEMEKFTFSDPMVRARLNDMQLLQADVTANSDDDKALLKRFRLFGPPGIILFSSRAVGVEQGRVIGFQTAERFLESLGVSPVADSKGG